MGFLNKVFLDYYNSVIEQESKLEPLSDREVLILDKIIGGNGYHKKIYGKEIFKLIRKKHVKLAGRSYFEAVFSDMAENTAKEAEVLLKKLKSTRHKFYILEFCTGSGSQTLAFIMQGFKVFTVEKNKKIAAWTEENFQRLGFNNGVFFHNGCLEDFFKTADFKRKLKSFSRTIDLIYADPPWKGHYYKSLNSDFRWEYMSPDGREIIKNCLGRASSVCLKLPSSMPFEPIYDFVKEQNLNGFVINQELKTGKRKLEEKIVFFMKNRDTNHPSLEVKTNRL